LDFFNLNQISLVLLISFDLMWGWLLIGCSFQFLIIYFDTRNSSTFIQTLFAFTQYPLMQIQFVTPVQVNKRRTMLKPSV